jgi:hypothetical protein
MNLSNILNDTHITEPEAKKPRYADNGHFYWIKGESIKLIWTIDGDVKNGEDNTYITAAEFLREKIVKVKMFNYMGNDIKEWKIEEPTTTIEILINDNPETGDLFSSNLATGTYRISVGIYDGLGLITEIVTKDDCIIEVK